MAYTVYTKTYGEPDYNIKEILRYAGVKESTKEIDSLLADAILDGILPPPVYINYNYEILYELELLYKKIKRF